MGRFAGNAGQGSQSAGQGIIPGSRFRVAISHIRQLGTGNWRAGTEKGNESFQPYEYEDTGRSHDRAFERQSGPIAGGTDRIGRLKDDILPNYPASIINIKTITPSLESIKEEGGLLKVGATTRLADIAASEAIKQKYTALAQAALRVATPHVRDVGTIGGNIAQLHRCWYFRKPENRFNCIRKGSTACFAMMGIIDITQFSVI